MVRVLLDTCVPHRLRRELTDADVVTAQYIGFTELADAALLAAIDGRMDVLVTMDTNLPYQNDLTKRSFAVIVVRVAVQNTRALRPLIPAIREAIRTTAPGEVCIVDDRGCRPFDARPRRG